jgi:hypothetical protein
MAVHADMRSRAMAMPQEGRQRQECGFAGLCSPHIAGYIAILTATLGRVSQVQIVPNFMHGSRN